MKQKNLIFRLVLSAVLVLSLAAIASYDTIAPTAANSSVYKHAEITSIGEAKQLLVDGNKRFVSGKILNDDISNTKRKELVKNGQHPFATILSCSDSRVPPELIFDQGLGDIFIIRTAGEVLDPVAEGSVEYGVEHLKTPLLVVLGHSECGAVKAAIETIESKGEMEGNIGKILKKIAPAVERSKEDGTTGDEIFTKTEDYNIELIIAGLMENDIIEELVEQRSLTILGAKYHVDSGKVTWLKEVAGDE